MNIIRNNVQLIGIVQSIKTSADAKSSSVILAVRDKGINMMIDIRLLDRLSEIAKKYIVRGKEIAISGKLQKAENRSDFYILVTDVLFLGKTTTNEN